MENPRFAPELPEPWVAKLAAHLAPHELPQLRRVCQTWHSAVDGYLRDARVQPFTMRPHELLLNARHMVLQPFSALELCGSTLQILFVPPQEQGGARYASKLNIFPRFSQLESLEIDHPGHMHLEALQALPRLRSLALRHGEWEDSLHAAVGPLAGMSQLTRLELLTSAWLTAGETILDAASSRCIGQLSGLLSLSIAVGVLEQDRGCPCLWTELAAGCLRLRELRVRAHSWGSDAEASELQPSLLPPALSVLAPLPLTTLDLEEVRRLPPEVSCLTALQQLRLAGMSSLRGADVAAALAPLTQLAGLTLLLAPGCAMTPRALAPVTELGSLSELRFGPTNWGPYQQPEQPRAQLMGANLKLLQHVGGLQALSLWPCELGSQAACVSAEFPDYDRMHQLLAASPGMLAARRRGDSGGAADPGGSFAASSAPDGLPVRVPPHLACSHSMCGFVPPIQLVVAPRVRDAPPVQRAAWQRRVCELDAAAFDPGKRAEEQRVARSIMGALGSCSLPFCDAIQQLPRLSSLMRLELQLPRRWQPLLPDGASLEILAQLPELRVFKLAAAPPPAGSSGSSSVPAVEQQALLHQLAAATQLRCLLLGRLHITSLAPLQALHKLKSLELRDCTAPIHTDELVALAAAVPYVRYLRIEGCTLVAGDPPDASGSCAPGGGGLSAALAGLLCAGRGEPGRSRSRSKHSRSSGGVGGSSSGECSRSSTTPQPPAAPFAEFHHLRLLSLRGTLLHGYSYPGCWRWAPLLASLEWSHDLRVLDITCRGDRRPQIGPDELETDAPLLRQLHYLLVDSHQQLASVMALWSEQAPPFAVLTKWSRLEMEEQCMPVFSDEDPLDAMLRREIEACW